MREETQEKESEQCITYYPRPCHYIDKQTNCLQTQLYSDNDVS